MDKENMIPFTDDFIFSNVMRHTEICRGILERVLPEEEFSDIDITPKENLVNIESALAAGTQAGFKFDRDAHGVRFDAYVKSRNMRVEIEMQTYSREDIAKRSRYYHANVDMDALASGEPYRNLKKAYVIFICTFDYMKQGFPVYHFKRREDFTGCALNDVSDTIILNTSCPLEKVPERLRPLYAYIQDPGNCDDEFIQKLDAYVRKYNSSEWRKKHMTLEHIIEQREDRINRLNAILLDTGRMDDFKKSLDDREYQKQLFKEFNL